MHSSSKIGAAGSSSSYNFVPTKWGSETGLPLVPCPKCGDEILELVAGNDSKVPGVVFFKCRLHERNDSSSCPWFLFADKYERMLIRKGLIRSKQVVPEIHTEVERLRAAGGDRDNSVPLLVTIGHLDANLKKVVTLGEIGIVCALVIVVFVVLGVLILILKRM